MQHLLGNKNDDDLRLSKHHPTVKYGESMTPTGEYKEVSLGNGANFIYWGEMFLGAPESQGPFKILFDTGGSSFGVMSRECGNCPKGKNSREYYDEYMSMSSVSNQTRKLIEQKFANA